MIAVIIDAATDARNTTTIIATTSTIGIHSGDNTQSHDQLLTGVFGKSFKKMNATVNSSANPAIFILSITSLCSILARHLLHDDLVLLRLR